MKISPLKEGAHFALDVMIAVVGILIVVHEGGTLGWLMAVAGGALTGLRIATWWLLWQVRKITGSRGSTWWTDELVSPSTIVRLRLPRFGLGRWEIVVSNRLMAAGWAWPWQDATPMLEAMRVVGARTGGIPAAELERIQTLAAKIYGE